MKYTFRGFIIKSDGFSKQFVEHPPGAISPTELYRVAQFEITKDNQRMLIAFGAGLIAIHAAETNREALFDKALNFTKNFLKNKGNFKDGVEETFQFENRNFYRIKNAKWWKYSK